MKLIDFIEAYDFFKDEGYIDPDIYKANCYPIRIYMPDEDGHLKWIELGVLERTFHLDNPNEIASMFLKKSVLNKEIDSMRMNTDIDVFEVYVGVE
jgi:hypothetical protein